MAYLIAGRRAPAAALLAAALLAGCGPNVDEGYEIVVYRDAPGGVAHEYPDPPAVTPGTQVGGSGPRIVAANLPQGVTQEMVDEGQELFGGVCAGCHGQGGAGSAAAPALNDAQWLNIDGTYEGIVTVITNGVANPVQFPGVMPPRGGGSFTDEQVRSIGAYVYALGQQGGA